MREFKVGDKVRVTKPDGIIGAPGWSDDMDDDIMNVMTVSSVGRWLGMEGSFFCYHPSWCELISESDPINHPAHYAGSNGIECIDAMRATLTADEFRGYCKGAAFKYIWRERQKGGNESLAKAVWYLNEAQK